ncbi:hypothetical protein KBC80_02940 [Candidatus Woesebacteria bacterium]|jgi:hypothetical protein|nr:hypothetical protein [Candidatus Woesebacteria bacterium]
MNIQLAQITNPVIPSSLGSGSNEAGSAAIGSIVGAIVGLLLVAGFVAAFIYLLMGGFDWITSGGDKAKLQSSRDKITNAIVGLIIVSSVWAIMTLVGQFVGIDFPNLPIPTIQN